MLQQRQDIECQITANMSLPLFIKAIITCYSSEGGLLKENVPCQFYLCKYSLYPYSIICQRRILAAFLPFYSCNLLL